MRRFHDNDLRELALEAIEEAAAASHIGPVRRSRGLALALAWLRHRGGDGVLPLWPFKSFWDALTSERQHDRWSAVNAAANAIYLVLDQPRLPAMISAFERQQRQPSGKSAGACRSTKRNDELDSDLDPSCEP